jgi:tryptophan synthase alpha chain
MEKRQEIELELTNHCNLSCTVCTRAFRAPQGFMSEDVFQDIFMRQDLPENIRGVCIAGFGEPLMNPRTPDFIRRLKEKYPDLFVLLYTNGILLHKEKIREELLMSGLDELAISFITDGDDLSLYKAITGQDPEKALLLIQEVLRIRDQIRSSTRVGVTNVVRPDFTDTTGEAYESFFKNVGVDFARTPLAHNRGGNVRFPTQDTSLEKHRCDFFDDVFYITWDGKAAICHGDIHRDHTLGDYTRQSFPDIYKEKQRARDQVLASPMCEGCDAVEMMNIGTRMNERYNETETSPIQSAFMEARRDNRVLFFPEVIIGHPDIETSLRAIEYLSRLPHTVVKTATPVADNFPSNTNDVIRRAHHNALKSGVDTTEVIRHLKRFRPNFLVVYPDSLASGVEDFLTRCRGNVDSVIFAEGTPDDDNLDVLYNLTPDKLAVLSKKYGISIVKIGYANSQENASSSIRATTDFIYLAGSGTTGGELDPLESIAHCTKSLKEVRDVPIMMGFGIKTPEQASRLAKIPAVDGITIGTVVFEALENGFDNFKEVIDGFWRVLNKT